MGAYRHMSSLYPDLVGKARGYGYPESSVCIIETCVLHLNMGKTLWRHGCLKTFLWKDFPTPVLKFPVQEQTETEKYCRILGFRLPVTVSCHPTGNKGCLSL